MSADLFLKILAVYLSLLGITWLLSPKAGLENDPGPKSLFVARLVGAYLMIIGVMNWLISSQGNVLVRDFLWANIVMNAMPIILNLINLARATFGRQAWVGIVTHILPVIGLVYFLVRIG